MHYYDDNAVPWEFFLQEVLFVLGPHTTPIWKFNNALPIYILSTSRCTSRSGEQLESTVRNTKIRALLACLAQRPSAFTLLRCKMDNKAGRGALEPPPEDGARTKRFDREIPVPRIPYWGRGEKTRGALEPPPEDGSRTKRFDRENPVPRIPYILRPKRENAFAGAHASGMAGKHFDKLRCSCPIWNPFNFKLMPRV